MKKKWIVFIQESDQKIKEVEVSAADFQVEEDGLWLYDDKDPNKPDDGSDALGFFRKEDCVGIKAAQ